MQDLNMENIKASTRTSKTKEEKLAFLRQQLADRERLAIEYRQKMQARIDLIEARGTAQDRKDQTRRKILSGAMLYDRIQKRKISNQNLIDWMNEFLTRDDDRLLFGLAPIDKNASIEIDNPDFDISDEATDNKMDNDDCHISDITVDEKKSELSDSFDNYN